MTVPGYLELIEGLAFFDCKSLKEMDLEKYVEIEEGAFWGCYALDSEFVTWRMKEKPY